MGEKGDNATVTNLQYPNFDFESQVLRHANLKLLMFAIGARKLEMPSRDGREYEVDDDEIVHAVEEIEALWSSDAGLPLALAKLYSYNSRLFNRMDRRAQALVEQQAQEEAAALAKQEELLAEAIQHSLSKKGSRINPERVTKTGKA